MADDLVAWRVLKKAELMVGEMVDVKAGKLVEKMEF
jgi:hypothetical protein